MYVGLAGIDMFYRESLFFVQTSCVFRCFSIYFATVQIYAMGDGGWGRERVNLNRKYSN